jgi:hypothetical protein
VDTSAGKSGGLHRLLPLNEKKQLWYYGELIFDACLVSNGVTDVPIPSCYGEGDIYQLADMLV